MSFFLPLKSLWRTSFASFCFAQFNLVKVLLSYEVVSLILKVKLWIAVDYSLVFIVQLFVVVLTN